ncbi:Fic family protein [Candidatus Beckwithbacteria bacterium]|nr:Fic family protein [Candidatus Beckwithbacteria bacterium]
MFEPKFFITNKILVNIAKLEYAKAIIDSAPLVPAWEKTFRDDATLRTVHYGTHLEGNDLSLGQARMIFEKVGDENNVPVKSVANQTGIVARERDIQEVLNYRKVLEYLDSLREQTQRFTRYTEDEIKQIHFLTVDKILSTDQAGNYRNSRVVIKDAATGEISFRPPTPVEVPFQIEHFLEWLNSFVSKDIHPVLRAGIAHYELVRIHPFLDGNGRVARALATLILFREGYDIKRFFSLEEYYDKNPADYYQALQSVNESDGDMTSWLDYFTFGLFTEIDNVKQRVKDLSLDERMLNRLGQQISLSERQIKLVEFLRDHEFLNMKDANKLLPMISEDTVLRELKDLMSKELIEKIGKTKGARYRLKSR